MLTEIIVLCILVIMIIAAIVLSLRNRETEKGNVIVPVPEAVKAEENNDDELVAIITAAIMAYSAGSNKSLVVKSFRKAGDNAPKWNKVSRIRN